MNQGNIVNHHNCLLIIEYQTHESQPGKIPDFVSFMYHQDISLDRQPPMLPHLQESYLVNILTELSDIIRDFPFVSLIVASLFMVKYFSKPLALSSTQWMTAIFKCYLIQMVNDKSTWNWNRNTWDFPVITFLKY